MSPRDFSVDARYSRRSSVIHDRSVSWRGWTGGQWTTRRDWSVQRIRIASPEVFPWTVFSPSSYFASVLGADARKRDACYFPVPDAAMSDTRRRRKSNQSCGSDDLSDSYEELNATKETQVSPCRTSPSRRPRPCFRATWLVPWSEISSGGWKSARVVSRQLKRPRSFSIFVIIFIFRLSSIPSRRCTISRFRARRPAANATRSAVPRIACFPHQKYIYLLLQSFIFLNCSFTASSRSLVSLASVESVL